MMSKEESDLTANRNVGFKTKGERGNGASFKVVIAKGKQVI